MQPIILKSKSAGFSLLELVIAMTITLMVMGMATTLMASAFRVRNRENQKSDALADAQRALNIMSREIANAAFNLNNNWIVSSDSNASSIRIRSNLNRFDTTASSESRSNVQDPGEDIKYFLNVAADKTYLVRYDEYGTGSSKATVLANRLNSFNIHYFDQRVSYIANPTETDISSPSATEVAPAAAKYIVISVSVTLDEVGTRGSPGYQPSSWVLLVSDVALRNADLSGY
jgi:type II secretory pathway pseudopilin PulG